MFRSICLCLVLASAIAAQQPAQAVPSNQAVAKFADGTIVPVTLLIDTLEVQTAYGKMAIPLAEVRRIEFGLRPDAQTEAQIDAEIRKLNSNVYLERDAASKALVAHGRLAWPSLRRATRAGNAEVASRAAEAVQKIAATVPANLLSDREEDMVHTVRFTVLGRIAPEAIKAHSPHFGEVHLKLRDLLQLHLRSGRGLTEVVLDAARNGSALDQWFETEITLYHGQQLVVSAEGKVDLWPQAPGQYLATPRGSNTAGKGGKFLAGALIGRFGESGKEFLIGERFDGTAPEEGKLYLLIVPSPWNNASIGQYQVKISTR
jgi:hypothetical protein